MIGSQSTGKKEVRCRSANQIWRGFAACITDRVELGARGDLKIFVDHASMKVDVVRNGMQRSSDTFGACMREVCEKKFSAASEVL
jgi:hypothetical protein